MLKNLVGIEQYMNVNTQLTGTFCVLYLRKRLTQKYFSMELQVQTECEWSSCRYSFFCICCYSCIWSRFIFEVSRMEKLFSKYRNSNQNRPPRNRKGHPPRNTSLSCFLYTFCFSRIVIIVEIDTLFY